MNGMDEKHIKRQHGPYCYLIGSSLNNLQYLHILVLSLTLFVFSLRGGHLLVVSHRTNIFKGSYAHMSHFAKTAHLRIPHHEENTEKENKGYVVFKGTQD